MADDITPQNSPIASWFYERNAEQHWARTRYTYSNMWRKVTETFKPYNDKIEPFLDFGLIVVGLFQFIEHSLNLFILIGRGITMAVQCLTIPPNHEEGRAKAKRNTELMSAAAIDYASSLLADSLAILCGPLGILKGALRLVITSKTSRPEASNIQADTENILKFVPA